MLVPCHRVPKWITFNERFTAKLDGLSSQIGVGYYLFGNLDLVSLLGPLNKWSLECRVLDCNIVCILHANSKLNVSQSFQNILKFTDAERYACKHSNWNDERAKKNHSKGSGHVVY